MKDNLFSSLVIENRKEYRVAAVLAVVLLLNVTGAMKYVLGIDTSLIVAAIAGYKTFLNSISALLEKRISADIALCVAVIAAISVGEFLAAAEAMFIVMVGETLESFAAGRTEAAIARFIEQMPTIARLLKDGREEIVDAASLAPDDRILVRAGERIPADGIIEQGWSSIDESSVTGEPLAREMGAGAEVYSGTLNGEGLLRIRVTCAGDNTVLSRVAQLVAEAKEQRAPVERIADRYAKFFLPALLLAGVLTFYFTGNWLRTVAVLIVACPCALILATPTAMVAAIGGLARRGILVRGGDVLQRAANVDTIVFDKTGTITEGRFEVAAVISLDWESEDQVLGLAAAAERGSTHALARIIEEECRRRRIAIPQSEKVRVVAGRGVECLVNSRTVRAGSAAFLRDNGIAGTEAIQDEADRTGATAVLVSDDGRLVGAVLLRDRPREGAREASAGLRDLGIVQQLILTGDRRSPAESIAAEVGIPTVEAELLPAQKLARIRDLEAQGRAVAIVGDGINDAPALAAATVGIAVAGAADIAAEAAGVVYLPHSLAALPQFFDVSRRAMKTAWLNIVLFAGIVNLTAVIACATGKLGPVGAAVTHQIASFCVMMNSLRLLRVHKGTALQWRPRLPEIDVRALVRPALAALAGIVILSGFYAVQPDEVGVIERFGRKVTPFSGPGLHYKLPWPIDRLTRLRAHQVRVAEIGFRSNPSGGVEPVSYEWNVRHRGGRFESRPEESLALTGDQNMVELNAVVHYDVEHPDDFLFRQLDGDATVRAAAESVIHGIASSTPLDDLLTTGRRVAETRALAELRRRMDRYECGVRIISVRLEAVHPSTDVVDSFRDVSAALEEKNKRISEAQGYSSEQIALARGNSRAAVLNAKRYAFARVSRSTGDANRFTQQEQAFRTAPGPTETRLYLEALDQALPGKKKLIVDRSGARRHLLFLDDGVDVLPLASVSRP